MSLEQLKAFLAKVKGDPSLQEKFKAAKSPEEVVAIATEHGHNFTVESYNTLSEVELEAISGGKKCSAISYCADNTGQGPGG